MQIVVDELKCTQTTSGAGADQVYLILAIDIGDKIFVDAWQSASWRDMEVGDVKGVDVPTLDLPTQRAAYALMEQDNKIDFKSSSTRKKLQDYLNLKKQIDDLDGTANNSVLQLAVDLGYGIGLFRADDDLIGFSTVKLDRLAGGYSQTLTGDGANYTIRFKNG